MIDAWASLVLPRDAKKERSLWRRDGDGDLLLVPEDLEDETFAMGGEDCDEDEEEEGEEDEDEEQSLIKPFPGKRQKKQQRRRLGSDSAAAAASSAAPSSSSTSAAAAGASHQDAPIVITSHFDSVLECLDFMRMVEDDDGMGKGDVIDAVRGRLHGMLSKLLLSNSITSMSMMGWRLQQQQQHN